MPTWRDDKILELASQLTYSPAEKRREQLNNAMALLPAIDATKTYPWDFIYFRITSIQLRGHIDHAIAGNVLRADLASLLEFLSDTLAIKVDEAAPAGDAVLELDDVTRKFNVSSKTIQRWRKQGLIGLRYVYPDGRRRLGFLESAVAQFAAANKERVNRSANFKQLSDEEKDAIIKLARMLVGEVSAAGSAASIKEISQAIGKKLKRATETIRYTIRRHDMEHPEAAIFPEEEPRSSPVRSGLVSDICESVEKANPEASPADMTAEVTGTQREQPLPPSQIAFVPNPLFEHPDAESIILELLPAEAVAKARVSVARGMNAKTQDVYMARVPGGLPAFLAEIFREPVMPQEIEVDAFRRMNYLKYRAASLLEESRMMDRAAGAAAAREAMEGYLSRAQDVKNQLLQSNLRIAVHVARKHQRPDRPLMELVSDATIWLMRAIETYDFTRGARFSTYAGYAIMKNFARDRAEQLTRRDARVVTGQQEVFDALKSREEQLIADQLDAASLQSDLRSVIDQLPERERDLLTSHYGLDQAKPALSLAQIGDKMGITKARVRQLEARALRRVRLLMEARREKIRRGK